jgi:hypothetical protein
MREVSLTGSLQAAEPDMGSAAFVVPELFPAAIRSKKEV